MLFRLLSCSSPILGLTLLASCSGLGSVPPEVVELYDTATPDGAIEIEIERDGSVRELEADVPLDTVPPKIIEHDSRQSHPFGLSCLHLLIFSFLIEQSLRVKLKLGAELIVQS